MNRLFHNQLSLPPLTLFCFNIMTFCGNVDLQKREAPIAYFSSKKDASFIGSGEVKVDRNNELFFYGFSTDNETLTRYLRPKIPLTLVALHKKKSTDYTRDLSSAMEKIMVKFFREHPTIDPCDEKTQYVLLSLLHLINTKKTVFTLECLNGKFQQIYNPVKCTINPLHPRKCFIPIIKANATDTFIQSPIYSSLHKNSITQKSMYERPQELIDRIIQTDTNRFLESIIQISELEWLKRCDSPAISHEYQSLRSKWIHLKKGTPFNTATDNATKLETSILSHWNHNRNELLKFAATLRQNLEACPAQLLFVDNLIEQAPEVIQPTAAEPSCLASLCALFTNDSVITRLYEPDFV